MYLRARLSFLGGSSSRRTRCHFFVLVCCQEFLFAHVIFSEFNVVFSVLVENVNSCAWRHLCCNQGTNELTLLTGRIASLHFGRQDQEIICSNHCWFQISFFWLVENNREGEFSSQSFFFLPEHSISITLSRTQRCHQQAQNLIIRIFFIRISGL